MTESEWCGWQGAKGISAASAERTPASPWASTHNTPVGAPPSLPSQLHCFPVRIHSFVQSQCRETSGLFLSNGPLCDHLLVSSHGGITRVSWCGGLWLGEGVEGGSRGFSFLYARCIERHRVIGVDSFGGCLRAVVMPRDGRCGAMAIAAISLRQHLPGSLLALNNSILDPFYGAPSSVLGKWAVFMRELGDGPARRRTRWTAGSVDAMGHLHAADPVSVTEVI